MIDNSTRSKFRHLLILYFILVSITLVQTCNRKRDTVSLRCPKSRRIYNDRGTKFTNVSWSSKDFLIVSSNSIKGLHQISPKVGTPATVSQAFVEGVHTVTYRAFDVTGIWATCKFKVHVIVRRCSYLDVPAYSRHMCSKGNLPGSTCRVTCVPGYHFIWNVPSNNGAVQSPDRSSVSVTCKVKGLSAQPRWSGHLPSCNSDSCEDPGQVVHARRQCSDHEKTLGSQCTFTCKYGMYPSTRGQITQKRELSSNNHYISPGDNGHTNSSMTIHCLLGRDNVVKWNSPLPKCKTMVRPQISHCPGRDIIVSSTGKRTTVHLPLVTGTPAQSAIICTGESSSGGELAAGGLRMSRPTPTHDFPVGKYRVRCAMALRPGELYDEFLQTCSFTVRVRDATCPKLPTPANGHIRCTSHPNFHQQICTLKCNKHHLLAPKLNVDTNSTGYTLQSPNKAAYKCQLNSKWSANYTDHRCVREITPRAVYTLAEYHFRIPGGSNCTNKLTFNTRVKIYDISLPLFKMCRTCLKTLRVKCSPTEPRLLIVTFALQWTGGPTAGYDSSRSATPPTSAPGFPDKALVLADIRHYLHEYKSRIVQRGAALHNFTQVPSPTSSSTAGGVRFAMRCDGVYYVSENACVPCGKGRIFSGSTCYACPPGTYQPRIQGTTCLLCNATHTTRSSQATSADHCIPKTSCLISPCQNGGSCYTRNGKSKCVCPKHYYGNTCQHALFNCSTSKCQHGATCVATSDTEYECQCQNAYSGRYCQHLKVAGGWSQWTEWSFCSQLCRSQGSPGTQTRSRACDSPSPSHGGSNCKGDGATKESRVCNDVACKECVTLKPPMGGKLECSSTSGLAGGPHVGVMSVVCRVVCPSGQALSTALNIPERLECGPYTQFKWPPSVMVDATLPSCQRTSAPLATRLGISTSSPYHCSGCNTTRLKRDLERSLSQRALDLLPCSRSNRCKVTVDSVECGHPHHVSKRSIEDVDGSGYKDMLIINITLTHDNSILDYEANLKHLVEWLQDRHDRNASISLAIHNDERLTVNMADSEMNRAIICGDYQQPSYDGRYCVECSQDSIWISRGINSESRCEQCAEGQYSYNRQICKACPTYSLLKSPHSSCVKNTLQEQHRENKERRRRIIIASISCFFLIFIIYISILISCWRRKENMRSKHKSACPKVEYL